MRPYDFRLIAVALVWVISACRCDVPPPAGSALGEIRVEYTDKTGATLNSESGTYDFGPVAFGTSKTLKLIVVNAGLGPLTLSTFKKLDGSPVQAKPGVDEANPVFSVVLSEDVEEQIDIAPGSRQTFEATFTPRVPQKLSQDAVEYRSVVQLNALNTSSTGGNAQITFLGKGVEGKCFLPAVIDFGPVQRGDTYVLSIPLENKQPIAVVAYVGAIEEDTSAAAGIFDFASDSPRDEFLITPGEQKDVRIMFSPTESRNYAATVRMSRDESCPETLVRLVGYGVDSILEWQPRLVDFGFSEPGSTTEVELTFTNKGLRSVNLSQLATLIGGKSTRIFHVIKTSVGMDVAQLTVPAATRDSQTTTVPGTAIVTLGFSPALLGPYIGTLQAKTNLARQDSMVVPLRGVAGGPDIEVRPSSLILDFGRVAFFPDAAPPTYAMRRLLVYNGGTRPLIADPSQNLKLGKLDGSTASYSAPYWNVATIDTGSSVDEICIGTFDDKTETCLNSLPTAGPGAYDPAIGLEASGASGILEIPVRITPSSEGIKQWQVELFSNDEDESTVTLTVRANVVKLPPCRVQVSPQRLNYGLLQEDKSLDLSFTIRNLGTQASDVCIISGMELLPETRVTGAATGAPPIFSLPAGEEAYQQELQPSATLEVIVRAQHEEQLSSALTTITGGAQFHVSNPTMPIHKVDLTATLGPNCLRVTPKEIDFGVVKQGCRSPDQIINFHQTCETRDTSAFSLQSASLCAGAECSDFDSTTPNVSSSEGFLTGEVTVGYEPTDIGVDNGTYLLHFNQNRQPVTYVIKLVGRGDANGLNTEVFKQPLKPKVDVLLVIDDSGSMVDDQNQLAKNFQYFISEAQKEHVDYRIAVTRARKYPKPDGKLGQFEETDTGTKVLKAGGPDETPNIEQEFARLVKVGAQGAYESCALPAVKALTPPLIIDPKYNKGFLRPEARLVIICATDATDQGEMPEQIALRNLLSIKGPQKLDYFSYNVIGPTGKREIQNCVYDDGPLTSSLYHGKLVTATGGILQEICAASWANTLTTLSKQAFSPRINFHLTGKPNLQAAIGIQVFLDDALQPQRNAQNIKVWTYNSHNNSIDFAAAYAPNPSTKVKVTYTAACL